MMKKVPKSTLKSIIKTKTRTAVNVRPTANPMVELVMLLFLNSLAEAARTKAFEEKSATIRAHHVRAVAKKMLKKAKG